MWFLPLFGTALVLALAYFFTRWLSGKCRTLPGGKHIRVIERAAIGQDKLLALVRVGGKVYFLGITGQSIRSIDSFDTQVFPEKTEPPAADFTEVLGRLLHRRRGTAPGDKGRQSDEE